MKNKYLACLDIKSLYTNITVHRCIERLENHQLEKKISITLC